jgi:excinuclease ABC subunit C
MILENINIPQTPGCYIFKDSREKIIYVGKSKFLPNRVKSYFQKNHEDIKTRKLVEKITNIDFVICQSESEALVVEENLIKLYQPEYNIKGKDDKTTRQVLIIEGDNFPRLTLARNTECGTNQILALFTSGRMAHEVYDLIHQIFPLRSCSYNLSQENLNSKKIKPCLELQMQNCLGPCVNDIKKFQYTHMISQIKHIFNFEYSQVKKSLKRQMYYFSKSLDFEKANDILNRIKNLDILIKKIEPLRLNKIKNQLIEIGTELKLKQSPLIIEAFDNSHTGGIEAVSASVRYVMGQPEKSSYRKYILREGSGADDYASFREVLHRRFKKLVDAGIQLPNLVVIDGAPAQLAVAVDVFTELGILKKLDVISISKDKNHRPQIIHTTNLEDIHIINLKSGHILANILEEVHRFVITFHRHRRDKI